MNGDDTIRLVGQVTADISAMLATLPAMIEELGDWVNVERWEQAHRHLVGLQASVYTLDLALHTLHAAGRIEHLPDRCPIGGRT